MKEAKINVDEENDVVTMDVETYNALISGIGSQRIFYRHRFKEALQKRYPDATIKEAGLALGIPRADLLVNGSVYPAQKHLTALTKWDPENNFIRKVPRRKVGVINLELLENHCDKEIRGTQAGNVIYSMNRGYNPDPEIKTLYRFSKTLKMSFNDMINPELPSTASPLMLKLREIALSSSGNEPIFSHLLRYEKISKKLFAELTGMSPSSISQMTLGHITPRITNYVKICKYFNVPLDYFTDWLE